MLTSGKGFFISYCSRTAGSTRRFTEDCTRMTHNQIDRQAKGILSKRDFTKKAQIGARGPTSLRKPKLLSSTQSRRKSSSKSSKPLFIKEKTKLERRRGCHGSKTMTIECTSINAAINSPQPAEYSRIPDGARANVVVLI